MSTESALRLGDVKDGDMPSGLDSARICYWKCPTQWWIYLPRAGIGRLTNHNVIEHEDGTISVKPSIALGPAGGPWKRHGYLTRGEWREM
jgi:hypothetical protein